ncbi:MAG: hypothetical protein DI601_00180 [Azospirillum brasilense]|nr:MAG: hypothetical protein DI601_00180 [Azospirillum brasilense]
MPDTISLEQFAADLERAPMRMRRQMLPALRHVGSIVRHEARRRIGREHEDWPALAESTVADRVRQGYPADKPLLRTGALRESIDYEADAASLSVTIGSDSEYAPAHEFGAENLPARPVFGPAAEQITPEVLDVLAVAAARVVAGKTADRAFFNQVGRSFRSEAGRQALHQERLANLVKARAVQASRRAARRDGS